MIKINIVSDWLSVKAPCRVQCIQGPEMSIDHQASAHWKVRNKLNQKYLFIINYFYQVRSNHSPCNILNTLKELNKSWMTHPSHFPPFIWLRSCFIFKIIFWKFYEHIWPRQTQILPKLRILMIVSLIFKLRQGTE